MKCACGCGGDIVILPHHKSRGIPKYIHGHNFKKSVGDGHKTEKGNIPWNKGKTCIYSEETLKNISNSLKGNIPWNKGVKGVMAAWNKGIPMSDESKQKLSESKKGKHSSPATEFKKGEMSGENHPNYGKKASDELKEKLSKAHIGIQAGENHPNYNPNLTDEERERGRKIPGYSEWSPAVLKRDNYMCQFCGLPIELNAHHIESYNNNPELRTTLSNGITMCNECHNDFHHQYGYGNNTKQQLIEFIKNKEENYNDKKNAQRT